MKVDWQKKIRTLFIITLYIFSHFARTFNLHEVYCLYLTLVTWISLAIYRLQSVHCPIYVWLKFLSLTICNFECLFHLWKLWNIGDAIPGVYKIISINIDNFLWLNNTFEMFINFYENPIITLKWTSSIYHWGPHDKFSQAQKKFWNFNELVLRIRQLFQ